VRSAMGVLTGLALILGATLAAAVLPPWVYEARRVKAAAVFWGQVVRVRQVDTARYYAVMLAELKLIKVFRGSPPPSATARVRFPSLRPGINPPPGPTIFHSLEPGELVLVFAASFDGKTKAAGLVEAGRATGAAAEAKLARTVGFYQHMAQEMTAKTGQAMVDPARARAQVALYQRIIAYLKAMP